MTRTFLSLKLHGAEWNWNFLSFSMSMNFGDYKARIEDVNFIIGDKLVARKQIFYDEAPAQLWEIEMDAVDKDAFSRLIEKARCPVF